MNGTGRHYKLDQDALQARFGLRVASRLSQASEQLPHDLTERLRVAREQALVRARGQRQLQTAPVAVAAGQGSLALTPPPSLWLRLASALPLLVLVVGLLLIQQLHLREEIHAAAEVDAALLADDLPPEAYGDPGFVFFLKQPEQ
jgi:Protein of unknown function (DUF3619)